jgi:hypothetical protein
MPEYIVIYGDTKICSVCRHDEEEVLGGGEGDIEVPFWHNFCMHCTQDGGPIGHF